MTTKIFVSYIFFTLILFAKVDGADLKCDARINNFILPTSSVSIGALGEIRSLYEADQMDRKALENFISLETNFKSNKGGDGFDLGEKQNYDFLGANGQEDIIQKVQKNDQDREYVILGLLAKERIRSPEELYFAAYILQHAQCNELIKDANRLAELAVRLGSEPAKWLYAASLDRYLLGLGQPQKYGTQFTLQNGRKVLRPVDPGTTDADRAKYNVPPLSKSSEGVARRQE
ncbi:MAG: hypothetical protein QM741_07025 [Rudaea sp.]|uniref:hypothetical protein n=1 Tax=Rudaea sp. TaxID=2136325 RepID=UPI0039E3AE01